MESLSREHFSLVQPQFAGLSKTQPMCTAVLAGIYPGRIYVDQAEAPTAALLLTWIESETNGVWAFLAGDPSNVAFNREVNQGIRTRRIINGQTPMLFWACDPGDWGECLDQVFDPFRPIWFPRYHFLALRALPNWRVRVPEGYVVEPLADDLLLRSGLVIPPDVAATLEKWRGLRRSDTLGGQFNDYGYVILDVRGDSPVIASWATVDFIANGRGDLGFFTQPEYRRQGLGVTVVSAALDAGFTRGLVQQVNWTCDADNDGSTRTAQKLGLERIADYQMAFWMLDEQRHQELSLQYSA